MKKFFKYEFIKYILELPNYLSIFILSSFLVVSSPILIEMSIFFGTSPANLNLLFTTMKKLSVLEVNNYLICPVAYGRNLKSNLTSEQELLICLSRCEKQSMMPMTKKRILIIKK